MFEIVETKEVGGPSKRVAWYDLDEYDQCMADWDNWITIAMHSNSCVRLFRNDKVFSTVDCRG